MADPVAEKSGFLKMYMSNHPDTLVAYAKWYGKLKEVVVGAEMSAIDTKSMTLTCNLKGGGQKTVVVPIEPPLRGYEDVKPRLLEMKAKAQEGLGMIQAPRITQLYLTSNLLQTAIPLALLCYCTFFPRGSLSPLFVPAQLIHSTLGAGIIKAIWIFVATLHALESVYTLSLCRKHRTPFLIGVGYVVATLLFGFPAWTELRRRIQAARIESVMKIQ